MRTVEKKRNFIRVIPQFTITPGKISLIAEESKEQFKKGDLVMQVSRESVYTMRKPLMVELLLRKNKRDGIKYATRPVAEEDDLSNPENHSSKL
jgi:hypothetical protein